MAHLVKILEVRDITHDVKSFKIEKPVGYEFIPGQATEVSINRKGFENEKRPFTFTSTNHDPHLEFKLIIFSRWGEVIFVSEDRFNSWDGIYREAMMPIGVYPWIITYEGEFEEYKGPYKMEGSVTLTK